MTGQVICPQCGGKLPQPSATELCPRCLYLVALGSDSEAKATADPTEQVGRFTPPTPSELGNRIPNLEVSEFLGQGGMGAVYKARQISLDRIVALKIIRPQSQADPMFTERFNREARTMARLNHPHIVAVHDFGQVTLPNLNSGEPGLLHYLVMEYVDGVNLRQLIRSETHRDTQSLASAPESVPNQPPATNPMLEPHQVLTIVPQICDALQYAHNEGIVHRDIKPENILIDRRGRVKIADFGLAKLVSSSPDFSALTATHQVMGTIRYMAPEQMEGFHAVDHRADIYSLGVVFYELLTGHTPIGHFEPPSQKVEIDVRLDDVVLRALAREPSRRYQHASDVKSDVEAIVEQSPDQSLSAKEIAQKKKNASKPELQRLEELAKIEPDWVFGAVVGLISLGWIAVGVLWNWELNGCLIAIALFAIATYYAIQIKLVYLPELRAEVARDSRWIRGLNLALSFVIFAMAILALCDAQVQLADMLTVSPIAGPRYLANQAANIPWFSGIDFGRYSVIHPLFGMEWIVSQFLGIVWVFAAVFSTIHTRRYRYTWRYWWWPSIMVTATLVLTIYVIHALHFLFTGGIDTTPIASREIRCEQSAELVREQIDQWMNESYYAKRTEFVLAVSKSGAVQESLPTSANYRYYLPRFWTDRYRASWNHWVLRPRPPIGIFVVEFPETAKSASHASDPATPDADRSHTRIRISAPNAQKPEIEAWNKALNDLEAHLKGKNSQTVTPGLDVTT